MPVKRSIDVRIAELEEKLTRLKLEKEIADLQDQMRSLRPPKRAARRRRVQPERKRAVQAERKRGVQAELIPARKKTAAKRKARAG